MSKKSIVVFDFVQAISFSFSDGSELFPGLIQVYVQMCYIVGQQSDMITILSTTEEKARQLSRLTIMYCAS
jgi:hypothetical protein